MAEYMAAATSEKVFFQLCYNILIAFNEKNRINEDDIHEYIEDIKQSFRNYSFDQINFNSPTYAYSYCYRYGPQSAALVRQKLLLAIANCQQLRQVLYAVGSPDIPSASLYRVSSAAPVPRASANPVVNVVNIGAGPGMDMVGFFSAVDDSLRGDHDSLKAKAINFHMIEPASTFMAFQRLIVAELKNNMGLASRLLNTASSAQFSLPCHEDEFITLMKSADIIIVCKLLSIIPFQRKREIVQNIRDYMQDSALLVWIDSPSQNEFIVGFDTLYQEPQYDVSTEVFSFVPYFYTKLHGPISESTKAKIRILKKSKTYIPM